MRIIIISLLLANSLNASPIMRPSFSDWYNGCSQLPRFEDNQNPPIYTYLHKETFRYELNNFFSIITNQLAKQSWFGKKPSPQFYGLNNDLFEPYVQKLVVKPDTVIAIHGDLHGDVHSLNRFIYRCALDGYMDASNPFKIKDPNFYILFLGDYVDRGWYGVEVIYAVLRLKNENPNQVFMVRGNHEDEVLNKDYGFKDELSDKYNDASLEQAIYRVYNFLPLAIYLCMGDVVHYDVIQCCHGGIEIGFDPRPLLSSRAQCQKIDSFMRKTGYAFLEHAGIHGYRRFFKDDMPAQIVNGFMWNDFIVDPQKPMALSARDGKKGTMFEYGKLATETLLQTWSMPFCTMRAIFRAHQHSHKQIAMMKRILNTDHQSHPDDTGVGKIWFDGPLHKEQAGLLKDISVVTFCVAPETGYNVPMHYYGILKTAKNFDDTRLIVRKLGTRDLDKLCN